MNTKFLTWIEVLSEQILGVLLTLLCYLIYELPRNRTKLCGCISKSRYLNIVLYLALVYIYCRKLMVNYTPTTVNTIEFVKVNIPFKVFHTKTVDKFLEKCAICVNQKCIILGFVFLCTCVLLVIENIVRSLIFLTEYIILLKYLQEKNNIFFCLLILDISRCTTAKQKKILLSKNPL